MPLPDSRGSPALKLYSGSMRSSREMIPGAIDGWRTRSEIWNGSERSREMSLASMKPPPANPAGHIGHRSEHEAEVAARRVPCVALPHAKRVLSGRRPAPNALAGHFSAVPPQEATLK